MYPGYRQKGHTPQVTMISNRRILTIQDISCVGQCSLTVAGPVISACGVEACILPSALLSNHTGAGFHGFTFRDLTEDIPDIEAQWEEEGIRFDAVCTGYLGSEAQIALVKRIMERRLLPGGIKIVDPAMADHGVLYQGFELSFVERMAELCGSTDIILPNLTEACLMTGIEYRAGVLEESYVLALLRKLAEYGAKTIILKGISFEEGRLGNAVWETEKGDPRFYFTDRIRRSSHGTGDCFAAAFVGGIMQGLTPFDAAALAADFVVESILQTEDDPEHWYGVKFERALPMLTARLNREKMRSRQAREHVGGRRRYIINGENFRDTEGFYREIDRVMTDGTIKTGHNLDAFNDILRGGFGKHGYGEPIELIWESFEKSRTELGAERLLRIVSIILNREEDHDCALKIEF